MTKLGTKLSKLFFYVGVTRFLPLMEKGASKYSPTSPEGFGLILVERHPLRSFPMFGERET